MLNAMRDGAHSKIIKFILFTFLVLAVAGMALMDVGGFFTSGVGNNMVAKAGKESISSVAFDQSLRRVLSQQGMQPREAYEFGMVDQVLESEINQRLLTQAALDMGIYAGNEQVARQISTLIEPLVQSQPGTSRSDMLRRLLQAQGMTEQAFVATMRREMMNTVLQGTIQTASSITSRAEALNLYLVQNETRDVDGLILSDASVKGIDDAPEEVLKAFYEAAKSSRFMIPETREFTIAVLTEDNIKSSLTVSDEELEKEYKKSISSYTLPERRVVEQAVLDTQEKAIKIAAAVRDDKKSLKDSVQSVTGKTTAYQDKTTFARQGLVKDIGDAAFVAEIDAVIDPIKTPLGWHVLVVKEILPESVKSFESVKDDLKKELSQGMLSAQLFNTANSIDDRLASGEAIGDIAKDMDLKLNKFGPVGIDGSTADKRDALKDFEKDRDYILQTAFELVEGESAPVLELSDGRYAALHVDKVKERSFKAFEDVQDELKKSWIADQKASLNRDRAQKIQQDIAAGTKTLSAAATELGVKVESFNNLKRTAEAPKSIGKGAIDALFDTVEGETIMTAVPNGILIGTIKSSDIPDPAKVTDKDLEILIEASERAAGDEFMQVYMQYLHDKKNVKVNRHLLNMMYGPESDPG